MLFCELSSFRAELMQGWEVDLSNTEVLGLATVFRRGSREMLPGVSPRS